LAADCCFFFLTYSRKDPKSFTFDHCFLSLDEEDSRFSSQEMVFEALGQDLLENAFQGYNACIFAYGQTGSENKPFQFSYPTFQ
jgi:hypothetical protein